MIPNRSRGEDISTCQRLTSDCPNYSCFMFWLEWLQVSSWEIPVYSPSSSEVTVLWYCTQLEIQTQVLTLANTLLSFQTL